MLIFVSNCSVLSEISIFSRNCQMVTCAIICTCHHETDSAWVNSFNKFLSNIGWMNRVRHDSLGVKTSNASAKFYGSLLILLFFLKICRMVNMSRHRDNCPAGACQPESNKLKGRVSAAPRPWYLTPFSQDPIIGTTVRHWSLETPNFQLVFKRFLSLLFP